MLALGNTLSALLTHPDQMDLLRSDPAEHTQWAIWEGLRWEPPVGLLPRACPEATMERHRHPAAHTDDLLDQRRAARPGRHEDPHRFDITRRATSMLAFGRAHTAAPVAGSHWPN